MRNRIFLIHWNKMEAKHLANKLRLEGWTVEIESESGERAGKSIRANPPDAVVIYLTRLPSHGPETADYLRSTKATQSIPIIFVDGREEAVEKTRAKIPDAVSTTSAKLNSILAKFSKPS